MGRWPQRTSEIGSMSGRRARRRRTRSTLSTAFAETTHLDWITTMTSCRCFPQSGSHTQRSQGDRPPLSAQWPKRAVRRRQRWPILHCGRVGFSLLGERVIDALGNRGRHEGRLQVDVQRSKVRRIVTAVGVTSSRTPVTMSFVSFGQTTR